MLVICSLVANNRLLSPSDRIARLERDLRDLRRSLKHDAGGSAGGSAGTPSSSSRTEHEADDSLAAEQIAVEIGAVMPPLTIGDVEVSPPELLALIDLYVCDPVL